MSASEAGLHVPSRAGSLGFRAERGAWAFGWSICGRCRIRLRRPNSPRRARPTRSADSRRSIRPRRACRPRNPANPFGGLVVQGFGSPTHFEIAEREIPLPPVPPADLRSRTKRAPLPPRRPSDFARPAEPEPTVRGPPGSRRRRTPTPGRGARRIRSPFRRRFRPRHAGQDAGTESWPTRRLRRLAPASANSRSPDAAAQPRAAADSAVSCAA